VTYTKAAAAEMQRRLFERLGEWCVTPDVKLREQLGALEGRDPAAFDHRELSKARGLFAKALETPGGLKIQTIHAFCEKLLRRFPLEAGVSPGFQVMDDSASAAIAQGALRQVAAYVTDHDDAFAQAYARFSVALDFASFEAMFATFESQRGAIGEYLAGSAACRARSRTSGRSAASLRGQQRRGRHRPRPWPSWTATSGARSPTCC
jgi:ATP-dependent helicase/nuclease subunit A